MNTSFEKSKTSKSEWLTPPFIIKQLGPFDIDPCSPVNRPWDTAKTHYTILDDGLSKVWFGRVWCNPPYGSESDKWLYKLKRHGNGIALLFARTETNNFFKHIWYDADAVLFIKGRLKFYHVTGEQADTAGAPSCLVAYGWKNALLLEKCGIAGRFVRLSKHNGG
jgi:hypothetical protein